MILEQVISRIEHFNNFLESISEKIVLTLLMIMAFLVTIEVFTRLFLNASITWSGELSRFLLIWVIFIGASCAYKKSELVAIEFFIKLYPRKIQKIVSIVCETIILVFLVLVIFHGFNFLKSMIIYNQVSPGLMVPIWWMYMGFYIGMILMLFYNIANIARRITAYQSNTETTETVFDPTKGQIL